MDKADPHLLLDVRPLVEVDICHLPTSISILQVTETQNQSHFHNSIPSDYICLSPISL